MIDIIRAEGLKGSATESFVRDEGLFRRKNLRGHGAGVATPFSWLVAMGEEQARTRRKQKTMMVPTVRDMDAREVLLAKNTYPNRRGCIRQYATEKGRVGCFL